MACGTDTPSYTMLSYDAGCMITHRHSKQTELMTSSRTRPLYMNLI